MNAESCGAQGIAIVGPNYLQAFNSGLCTTVGMTLPVAISGLVAGERLVDIDFRPQTGQLYGLGFNAASGTGSATLYLLDPTTAAATIVGAASGVANGSGTPIDLAGATAFGFDFNPTVDRIRVVSNNGLNFRLNPNDGTVVGGALDAAINGLPAGSQGLVGAAYTNSYGQALDGSGVTTLYTLDPVSDMLFIQNPANGGTQTRGIPVTVNGQRFDIQERVRTRHRPSDPREQFERASGRRCLRAAGIRSAAGRHGRRRPPALHRFGHRRGSPRLDHYRRPGWFGLAFGDAPRNATTLAVTSSAPSPAVGQPVTFTATIGMPSFNPGFPPLLASPLLRTTRPAPSPSPSMASPPWAAARNRSPA